MLRFGDIVFGPVHSRRLGSSLGINLLPVDGKLCNFDCIYCECGWNADGRDAKAGLPSPDDVREAVVKKLQSCRNDGIQIDSITFSGNGEPTLHPAFAEIVDITLEARDRYFPAAKVSVLSNATRLMDDSVLAALKKVDNPILKIDASSDFGAGLVNRPSGGYSVRKVVERMKEFCGNFVLQTMFLRGTDFDTSEKGNLAGWMSIVRAVRPRAIMVYTIDRETPQKGLCKFTVREMEEMVRPLADEGFDIQIKG
ncbi:MAG: radical SAM protein [Clostridium sp.]|nr:radical SAM protein [Bacteroides sp.]MCM1199217.1 radical SAM protein [Clostridium sp.]